jgi:hypothetical protein
LLNSVCRVSSLFDGSILSFLELCCYRLLLLCYICYSVLSCIFWRCYGVVAAVDRLLGSGVIVCVFSVVAVGVIRRWDGGCVVCWVWWDFLFSLVVFYEPENGVVCVCVFVCVVHM